MSTLLTILPTAVLAQAAKQDGVSWLPPQASTIAPGVDHTLDVINWICYVFFALVVALMVGSMGIGALLTPARRRSGRA